ncbi:MBL fold metallo-hydrolase [Heyndrickxia vini]|uniref:MBL fold metallo-hydrolase n=1 Tax=Heyndrickxia vini TaxID=1476025 RepID=A0ABX7E4G4_9BACI|nr:MBL fold metallo-hydrolase [Heyndrickxia vini]
MMKIQKLVMSFILLLSFAIFPSTSHGVSKNLYVHFIDVDQGDSIYIKTPAGDDILIDGGNRDGSDVVTYLKKQKVKDIDVMISTHPDADHTGGLDEVLKAFKVKSVYAPKVSHTTQVYKDFLSAVKHEGVKIKSATKGVTLPLKGVTAKFIAPVKTYSTNDLNDWSAVLKLTYGSKSFLFTGDAETKSETDMIHSNQSLKADVLKVGHHGANTSTSSAFLHAVHPTYAVISVGKGNQYGHPTSTVLKRLGSNKVKVFRTDTQGTIIAKTDGKSLSFNSAPVSSTTSTSKSSAKGKSSYKLFAKLDNTRPKQYSTIHLTVKGIPTGTYKAVFHYKSKNTTYNGKIGKSLPVKISRASTSFRVKIDVTAKYKGKTYKTQTSFIPK